jgi:hypothetical protein
MAAFRTRELDQHESPSGSPGSEASRPQDTDAPVSDNSSAPSLPVLPLSAAVALLLVVAAVIAAVLLGRGGSGAPEVAPPRAPQPQAEPIRQAKWQIRSRPAKVGVRITKHQRRQVARQGDNLARLVRDVYAAVFLDPERRKDVLQDRFTSRASYRWTRSGAGLPRTAIDRKTVLRRARIVIDPLVPRRAVATVVVRIRSTVSDDALRLRHSSTLWLQRSHGRWRVFAFDVDQRRVRRR